MPDRLAGWTASDFPVEAAVLDPGHLSTQAMRKMRWLRQQATAPSSRTQGFF